MLLSLYGSAQTDTARLIKVHFLYGSKPGEGHKGTEARYFGGLHGGHVSIEVDSIDYGFVPAGRLHIFPHRNYRHSAYVSSATYGMPVYPADMKVVTIVIQVRQQQYDQLKKTLTAYDSCAPYDYAFFGMRCAASTEDVLGQIGLIRSKSRLWSVCSTFYPKKLRRRLLKMAAEKQWQVIFQEGRPSRKWEKD